MRPKLEQIAHRTHNQSFVCYEVKVPAFEFVWHYHPEYELTYIVKGSGKRLVGDSYENFEAGDVVLLGPMLPHTWVTEKKLQENCSAIVIQFTNSFAEQLLQFPEMSDIGKLFAKTCRGIRFYSSKNKDFAVLLKKMIDSNDLMKLTLLIQVLQQLCNTKYATLSSAQYKIMKGNENQQRINKVLSYIQKDCKENITLHKAASLIHLSESAFCKFFKRATGKTFSDYTNDIRVANVCQLLIETDKPISEIAFGSGFDSLTYFNRIFLKKKKIRPGQWRKQAAHLQK
jgi:AraC-like DNA-binding protein/mannose-6-phosphate isomerase-like protein (cupin superfamily)